MTRKILTIAHYPYEPRHEKTCFAICEQQRRRSACASSQSNQHNNKGADQPAHPRSLISTFVVRCLDSIISVVSICKILSLYLVSVVEQGRLSLTWSEIPKTGLLVRRLIYKKDGTVTVLSHVK